MPDNSQILVYLVDDDCSILEALSMLMLSADIEVQAFKSAEKFLKSVNNLENACLISDIKMKGMNGFSLQRKLNERGLKIPVIFLSTYDTPRSRQQAQILGAAGFLQKPVDGQALLDTIHWALCSSKK